MEHLLKEVKQGDLVLLPFPFTDLKTEKVRPAIVISNEYYNSTSEDCILLPLTSVLKETKGSILITQRDLYSGELLKQSRIRVDKIFCLEKSLIYSKLGTVSGIIVQEAKKELNKLL